MRSVGHQPPGRGEAACRCRPGGGWALPPKQYGILESNMPIRSAAALLLFAALSPREESCHFELTLEVKGAASRQEARRSAPDLPGKLPPRPLLRIRAGEEVTLKWNVLAFPQNRTAFKDITIH